MVWNHKVVWLGRDLKDHRYVSFHLVGNVLIPLQRCHSLYAISLFQSLVHGMFRWNRKALTTANLHLWIFGGENKRFFWGYNAESIPVKQKTFWGL